LHDLYELRRNGCAQAIVKAYREGASVLGICGGYQLMGIEVCDPDHVEGDIERLPGLGLLPVTTTMSGEKLTRQVKCEYGEGYEIHMGETRPFGDAEASPMLHLHDGRADGYRVNEKCMGTYVHGILDNAAFVDELLKPFAEKFSSDAPSFDYQAYKEEQYNKLADHVRRYVDMERVYQILSDHD
jgi:adenosylcobyric acid synthase